MPASARRRLTRVAELVGLGQLLDRKPAQLSGGQRQRMALARAIVAENPILLMDEPLSNLDAQLRHDMRVEIRALQRRLGITVVYVTHDQIEAMSMADQVILMREGQIEQSGTPERLYAQPATLFAARFIGTPPMNLLPLADSPDGAVVTGSDGPPVLQGTGAGLALGVRPEDIRLDSREGVPATVTNTDYHGADTVITARTGEASVLMRVPGRYPDGVRSDRIPALGREQRAFIRPRQRPAVQRACPAGARRLNAVPGPNGRSGWWPDKVISYR